MLPKSESECSHACADPFAVLEDVAPPAAAVPPATPNLVDLDDLLGAGSPVHNPLSQSSPFNSLPAQSHQPAAYGPPMPQMASVMPATAPQAQTNPPQQQKTAPVAGGPAPMAPRGNAAVEQQAGRKDPFADLFS